MPANCLNAPIVSGSQGPNKGTIFASAIMIVVLETKIETMKKTKTKRKWKKEIEI